MEMSYWPELEHPLLDYLKTYILSHLGAAQRIIKTRKIPYIHYVVSSFCSFISSLQCICMDLLFLC